LQNNNIPKKRYTLSRKTGLGRALCIVFLLFSNYIAYAQVRFEYKYQQMGTQIRLVFYTENKQKADSVSSLVFERIDNLNHILSDYIEDSELNMLTNEGIGDVTVSNDLYAVLKKSVRIAEKTNGAFDITAGPLIRLWRRTRKSKIKPTPSDLEAAKEKVGYQYITFPKQNTVRLGKQGLQLDLGGIGKGFTADEVIKILLKNGITSALIDMGGDIRVSAPPPGRPYWVLAFSYYDGKGDEIVQKIKLKNAAVATSGDVYQFVEIDGIRYSHIVNPLTGMALTTSIQVSVIAENATKADAYASALSVMGIEKAKEKIKEIDGLDVFLVENMKNNSKQWHTLEFKKFLINK
jgi:FAD:protein FMN transferase